MTVLSGWENFYVIVGSSAGALIGLQFVAMSLIAELPVGPGTQQAGSAFATPTIVHFGAVLMLSAALSAPWQEVSSIAAVWGVIGWAGVLYAVIVTRRMRRQTAYKPEFEDWMFHALLPLAAYLVLGGAALLARPHVRGALFAVAGATLLLLFIGIHNAWDAVTYHVFVHRPSRAAREKVAGEP